MAWEGSCNRCGLCCTKMVDGIATRCENLDIISANEAVCSVYDERTPWMPIALLDGNDQVIEWSHCQMTYPYDLDRSHTVPDKCGFRWVDEHTKHPKP